MFSFRYLQHKLNMQKRLQELTGIRTVIGGFHLRENDEKTRETIKYFRKASVKYVCPSHCTELPALAAFYDEFKIKQVKTGMVLDI